VSDPQLDTVELDTKIMRSSAWAVLGYGGTHALSLVATIVLARLLVPADFGLVALSTAVLAVAYLAQESGLGAALVVHRGDLRPAAASAAIFSPLVAFGLYVAAFVASPFLADVFNEPRLSEVLRVTALVLIIRGFTIMPLALLQRRSHCCSGTCGSDRSRPSSSRAASRRPGSPSCSPSPGLGSGASSSASWRRPRPSSWCRGGTRPSGPRRGRHGATPCGS
jgi:hypothetical protein